MTQTRLPKEFTAMALIVTKATPKQALLVQSRKHKLWMPPGGHVKSYENPFEATIREVREETKLDITAYIPSSQRYDENRVAIPLPMRITEIRLTHGGAEHYHVDFMYRVELPAALPVEHDDMESAGIGWFTREELDALDIPADVLPALQQELR